jgi:osmoprotectant transport system ATP-binding protein
MLRQRDVNSVFVVDEHDMLKGWVDFEEIEHNDSLLDAMFEAPYVDIAVRQDATAREALSAMVARSFRVTPVTDNRGKLVGSISLKTLQDLISEAYDITPSQAQDDSMRERVS